MKKIIKEEYLGIDRDICGCGDETEMFLVVYDDGTEAIQHREPRQPDPTTFETMEALLG